MSTRLGLRDLTRRHPGQPGPALHALDVDVDGGACLALLGPSGSGKSTALRLIAGLDTPTRGRVLLLDEPFGALDSALRSDMYALLRAVRDELNPTIVLVTHDQSEAAAVADSIAVLIDGALEHHSDVRTAYVRPATLAVHRLMGGLNEIHGCVSAGVHHSEMGSHLLSADVSVRDGPATLVFRHEMVHLTSATDSAPTGTITSLQPAGIRCLACVHIGGASVFVELEPQMNLTVGADVGVQLPADALHAISTSV